jgi:hypothetical protein
MSVGTWVGSISDGRATDSALSGRGIVQAVSSRLANASARIRGRVKSFGICGRQSGTGTGFLLVL